MRTTTCFSAQVMHNNFVLLERILKYFKQHQGALQNACIYVIPKLRLGIFDVLQLLESKLLPSLNWSPDFCHIPGAIPFYPESLWLYWAAQYVLSMISNVYEISSSRPGHKAHNNSINTRFSPAKHLHSKDWSTFYSNPTYTIPRSKCRTC